MSDQPLVLRFPEIPPGSVRRVGGKGESLAVSFQAGLPVPPGFVVTTDACARIRGYFPADVKDAVLNAYRDLGEPLVAVRSSATAEDSADHSFAGQQETILGVQGDTALFAAIERCIRSLDTERAQAYRREQGITETDAAIAVVVQKLVDAEAAGVLFTRDPVDPQRPVMIIESAWGLGEAVVSGRVDPDRFELDRAQGTVLAESRGSKLVRITRQGEEAVPPTDQTRSSLTPAQIRKLFELGQQVEQFYSAPRDIEWAAIGESVFLLQARPITTSPSQERRQIREAVITDARKWAGPNKTVWVKYNLSEVLPSPTPMTWSILRTMLAQDGGFGAMNRDLGAKPDVSLGSLSAFDLIAGRPMMNLTRMPRMQFAHPPFEYPFEKYKPDPRLARNPKPDLNPLRHGILSGLLRLPSMLMRLHRMKTRLAELTPYFVERFQNEIVPRFLHDVEVARAEPWSSQSDAEILKHLDRWIQRTLVDFARESLKPTVLADYLWNKLVTRLSPKIGPEKAEVLVSRLTHGAHPTDPTTHLAHGLQQLALGQLTVGEFLSQFGHRGPNEMDLAQPRWAEDPSTLPRAPQTRESAPPNVDDAWHEAIREARLPISQQQAGSVERDQLRTYLGLRESAKHHLLRGYALIRRALLELDQRWNYRGGIFFLTREELSSRPADAVHLIRTRKKRRQRELQLELPDVLFSDDLEAIGRSLPIPQGAESWQGVGISPGSTHGSALVLTEPTAPPAGAPYILVCPSTDPAWVPLFLQAQGLVMETGGVLSHGAIVAREFGIPAVAGIPGIVRQLRTGEAVVLDGTLGTLSRVPAESPCSSPHGPF